LDKISKLLTSGTGSKYNDSYTKLGDFKRSWKKCLDLTGIVDFRFHDLRHMVATKLLDDGVPMPIVASIGNWVDTKMLATYYNNDSRRASLVVFNHLSR
jgi:integrase